MLFPTITKIAKLEYPEISFAPEFIRLKLPGSIYSPEASAISGISTDATTIFLKHYCAQEETPGYPSKSKISLRNDCDSAIRNLTLTSRNNKKEVLFLAELNPGKTFPLIFLKNDIYDIDFWASSLPISIHSSLKIVAPVNLTTGFKINLKPAWLK